MGSWRFWSFLKKKKKLSFCFVRSTVYPRWNICCYRKTGNAYTEVCKNWSCAVSTGKTVYICREGVKKREHLIVKLTEIVGNGSYYIGFRSFSFYKFATRPQRPARDGFSLIRLFFFFMSAIRVYIITYGNFYRKLETSGEWERRRRRKRVARSTARKYPSKSPLFERT